MSKIKVASFLGQCK